jgi:hypothetical protein
VAATLLRHNKQSNNANRPHGIATASEQQQPHTAGDQTATMEMKMVQHAYGGTDRRTPFSLFFLLPSTASTHQQSQALPTEFYLYSFSRTYDWCASSTPTWISRHSSVQSVASCLIRWSRASAATNATVPSASHHGCNATPHAPVVATHCKCQT